MKIIGTSISVAHSVVIAYVLAPPPTAAFSSLSSIVRLFSAPRNAEAMFAVHAAMSAPHAKSSSFADASAMPPMIGRRQRIFAFEIDLP